jgi:hypothetical protein
VSHIYKSGAFAQQCFAVHPLCLSVKKFSAPDTLLLSCSSCHFQHQFKIRDLTAQHSQSAATQTLAKDHQTETTAQLAGCAKAHAVALRVNSMDVEHDTVGLRCSECRIAYAMDVAIIETREP